MVPFASPTYLHATLHHGHFGSQEERYVSPTLLLGRRDLRMSEVYVPVMPSRRVSSVLRGIIPGDDDLVERACAAGW